MNSSCVTSALIFRSGTSTATIIDDLLALVAGLLDVALGLGEIALAGELLHAGVVRQRRTRNEDSRRLPPQRFVGAVDGDHVVRLLIAPMIARRNAGLSNGGCSWLNRI